MTRYPVRLTGLLAVLLAATACGAQVPEHSNDAAASPSASACRGDVVRQYVQADVDGDGTAEPVDYEPAGTTECPAGLSAVVGQQPVFVATSVVPTSMRAVTIPGRKGQLLVVRETHPRGGFQDHLFGYADGKLAELTAGGNPVFPFVATDTPDSGVAGFSARCVQGGIEVLRAVAHEPIGIVPAFDIRGTTYTVDGTTLTQQGVEEVADNVLDKQLAARFPALARRDVLTEGCG